ncbi:uncharacterized protein LOC127847759 [Dreissena polymorpha]|uniref:uncharacterized protein LOC127847759 n=1 Tax=Dreissena polymorpha TaxID=45954 RepID=UPI0022643561|nr:uncharacterized protein LOC127847759 [Dreissena polymorpha]
MCMISPCEVVITTNEQNGDGLHGLQMITVRNYRLQKGNKIQLPHNCVGIAHHKGSLYVTSGKALYHYTLTGTVIKKLYEDTIGSNTVYKCAVNVVSDTIFVTNIDKNTLLTLAMDGTVISTFSAIDLKGQRGVHVTASDQEFVSNASTSTIIQVNSDGKKKLPGKMG